MRNMTFYNTLTIKTLERNNIFLTYMLSTHPYCHAATTH